MEVEACPKCGKRVLTGLLSSHEANCSGEPFEYHYNLDDARAAKQIDQRDKFKQPTKEVRSPGMVLFEPP